MSSRDRVKVKVRIKVGRYEEEFVFRVPKEIIRRFKEACTECKTWEEAVEFFARDVEETINSYIERAYDPRKTVSNILAQASVLLATELVITEEVLKKIEGGLS
ncbi:MAG: hypothetical protein GXO39_02740 [Thermotogae bacterium]|nr:hypothetical protein [Thermotogota bacterium]